jgi:hypothetical protein
MVNIRQERRITTSDVGISAYMQRLRGKITDIMVLECVEVAGGSDVLSGVVASSSAILASLSFPADACSKSDRVADPLL